MNRFVKTNDISNKELCIKEVTKNIMLAEAGLPLTQPLGLLKNNCEFKKYWDKLGEPIKKLERKAYRKAYYQRPEMKAKRKAYMKAYRKAYYQRPEMKAKRKAYMKAYGKAYYQKNKERGVK